MARHAVPSSASAALAAERLPRSQWLVGVAAIIVPLVATCFLALALVRWLRGHEGQMGWVAGATVGVCVLLAAQNAIARALRERRARRWGQHRDEAARLVARLAADPDDAEARAGLRAAGTRLGPFRALAPELAPEDEARLRAALREEGAAARLLERAGSRRRWRRVEAILHLGWLAPPEAVDALAARLHDGDEETARAAARALAGYRERAAYDALLAALAGGRRPRSRMAAVLERSRVRDPLPSLEAAAAHPEGPVRFWAAYLLGRTGLPGAFPALARLAVDPDPNVRANATEALGGLRHPDAVPLVRARLRDDVWYVRSHAAKAAGALRDPRLLGGVAALFRDPHWWVRQNAMLALERFGQGAVPRLAEALDDPDRFARNTAVEALGRLGAVAEQVERLGGTGPDARAARGFLLAFGRAEGVRALEDALATAAPRAQERLVEVLAEVGDAGTLPALAALPPDAPAAVRAGARRAARLIGERTRTG
jgi:HEAT repeat protein